jgi:hypothetical protein
MLHEKFISNLFCEPVTSLLYVPYRLMREALGKAASAALHPSRRRREVAKTFIYRFFKFVINLDSFFESFFLSSRVRRNLSGEQF